MLEEKARETALRIHKGQYRKDGVTPYDTHLEKVVFYLKMVGVEDEPALCAGWLHDGEEEGGLTRDYIAREFNEEVAELVAVLTRDVDREAYKQRLLKSGVKAKLVKLADTIHNCESLYEGLPEETIRHKVEDSLSFYIPMADEICPKFAELLREYIEPWKDRYSSGAYDLEHKQV